MFSSLLWFRPWFPFLILPFSQRQLSALVAALLCRRANPRNQVRPSRIHSAVPFADPSHRPMHKPHPRQSVLLGKPILKI
jgi:hypothetical protein